MAMKLLASSVSLSIALQSIFSLPTSNDYKVTGLGKFGAKDDMYSGFLPVDSETDENDQGSLFFWLVKQRPQTRRPNAKRLVVWLNGGPGCSSMLGMMYENGPFSIQEGEDSKIYELKDNPFSWNEAADILYVDQPLRTGFSVAAKDAKLVSSEKHVAKQFHGFLRSFMRVFTEYEEIPVFLTGESYAGLFIPWIAEDIVRYNEDAFYRNGYWPQGTIDEEKLINLQGVAIGNGMIDFITQEKAYAEYAYTHGLIPIGVKKVVDQLYRKCVDKAGGLKNAYKMTRLDFVKCGLSTLVFEAAGKPNEYNIGTFQHNSDIIHSNTVVHKFFNDEEIQVALHVRGSDLPGLNFSPEHRRLNDARGITIGETNTADGIKSTADSRERQNGNANTANKSKSSRVKNERANESDSDNEKDESTSSSPSVQGQHEGDHTATHVGYYGPTEWHACDLGVNLSLLDDHPVSSVPAIQYISQYISVFLYSGELDSSINTLGTIHTLEYNEWLGEKWKTASRALWKFAEDVAGEYFQLKTISLLIVRNAGHMMPMDKPATALEMITKFLDRTSFADVPLLSDKEWVDKIRQEYDISKNDYLDIADAESAGNEDDDKGMVATGQKDGRVNRGTGVDSRNVGKAFESHVTVASALVTTTSQVKDEDEDITARSHGSSVLEATGPMLGVFDQTHGAPSSMLWVLWCFLLFSSPAVLFVLCVGRVGPFKWRPEATVQSREGFTVNDLNKNDSSDESRSLKYGDKIVSKYSEYPTQSYSLNFISSLFGSRRKAMVHSENADSVRTVSYQHIPPSSGNMGHTNSSSHPNARYHDV